jgi:hypothetical protein
MNLLILHLSDIHLKREANAVIGKVNGLRGVIEAHAANIDACVIAISGDIAYSGTQSRKHCHKKVTSLRSASADAKAMA